MVEENSNLEEIEVIADDLQEGEHEDTGGDGGDTCVHVLVGGHLLLLDIDQSLQEGVPLVHLIC